MNVAAPFCEHSIKEIIAFSILGLLCLSAVQNTFAQPGETINTERFSASKQQLQTAIASGDRAAIKKAARAFHSFMESNSGELKKLAYYYAGYANYRLGTQLRDSNDDQHKKYLDKAVEYLKRTVGMDPAFAEGWVLLGSVFGLKSNGMFAAMKYGPKSNSAMEKALKTGPNNPRVHMLNAIGLLYKPRMFGGSTEEATREFNKAARLYQSYQPENRFMPDWGHAEVYAWLGQACEKQEKYQKAEAAYRKALEINPQYKWVKDELMPALAGKLN